MKQNSKGNVPNVSIDEALGLFLTLACPDGIPAGEEGEKIVQTLREKIAKQGHSSFQNRFSAQVIGATVKDHLAEVINANPRP